jgi:hypothetical protein
VRVHVWNLFLGFARKARRCMDLLCVGVGSETLNGNFVNLIQF